MRGYEVRTVLVWAGVIGFLMIINHIRVYAYDPLTLLSFTLAALMLTKNNWPGFLAAFTLATINRETSFLLILLFAFYQTDYWHQWKRIGLMIAIFAVIRGGIIWLFWDWPGGAFETHYSEYLEAIEKTPVRFALTYSLVFCIAWMALASINKMPQVIRAGMLAVYFPLIVLMVLFGNPYEIRVLVESQPFIALFVLQWIGMEAP